MAQTITVYPGELVVSILARYRAMLGNDPVKRMLSDLFESANFKFALDLPSNIERLCSSLAIDLPAERMIREHTLLPYFSPFLAKGQAAEVTNRMLNGDSLGVHCMTGIAASRVPAVREITLCPVCVEIDMNNYGEPYWHREHHVPCIRVCPHHNAKLFSSCPTCGTGFWSIYDHGFPASMTHCVNGHPLTSLVEPNQNEGLLKLAKDSLYILQGNFHIQDLNTLRALYLRSLMQLGIATPSGRVRQSLLHEKFTSKFDASFLASINIPDVTGSSSWLADLVRRPKKSQHPIFHTLLMEFIGGGVCNFSGARHSGPFGNGPWPCLNKVASHYKKFVIKDLEITRCSSTGLPVGTFKCDCGFVYSKRGPLKPHDNQFTYGRVKEYGHEWEEKLAEISFDKSRSIRSIAREMGTDSKVILRHMNNSIDVHGEETTVPEDELTKRRESMYQKIIDAPEKHKTQIRRENQADYTWLYRHDKKWLEQILSICNCPARLRKPRFAPWEARDEYLQVIVKQEIDRLKESHGKPIRVTISRIGRLTKLKPTLEKNLDKLPSVKSLLNEEVESTHHFQKRRVSWAVKEIKRHGHSLLEWRIARYAGLKWPLNEEMRTLIHDEIEENENRFH